MTISNDTATLKLRSMYKKYCHLLSCRGQWKRLFIAILAMSAFWPMARGQQLRMEGIQDYGYDWSRSWVDVNGDGKSDYCLLWSWNADRLRCYLSTGSTFNANPLEYEVGSTVRGSAGYVWGVHWVDINGDGRIDFCRMENWPRQLSCRFGPNFLQQVSLAVPIFSGTSSVADSEPTPPPPTPGLRHGQDLFLVDVDADGRSDVCYLFAASESSPLDLRCHLATDAGFSQSASIAFQNVHPGIADRTWPRSFVDFNGDGYPDFCRVLDGGSVRCTMGGPMGFTGEITMPPIHLAAKEGASFVDFNGDGKTDMCRIVRVETPPQNCVTNSYVNTCPATVVHNELRCSISNGLGWEPTERKSPPIDAGDAQARWWVDINADGIPDFCRGVNGSMKCRLGRGDTDGVGNSAFAYDDVSVENVNFGLGFGRSFCDPVGNGIQTYCRATHRMEQVSTSCYETESGGPYCGPVMGAVNGILAGFPGAKQASQSLVTAIDPGVGMETRITYAPMTDANVYQRTGFGSYPRSLITLGSQPLVMETRAWTTISATNTTPTTLTGVARYFYRDQRSDTWAGGLGFRERWMFTEGSNTLDHTVFFQGLGPAVDATSRLNDPLEIGLVRTHERFAIPRNFGSSTLGGVFGATRASPRQEAINAIFSAIQTPSGGFAGATVPDYSSVFHLLSRTTNSLSSTVIGHDASVNPRYRYIGAASVQRNDLNNGSLVPLPATSTVNEQDYHGNVLRLSEVSTDANGLQWSKTTTSEFSSDARWRRLGRLTKSTVVSTAPTADAQIAAVGRSAGSSPNASATSSPVPSVPQPVPPLRPELLMPILQLLLED